MITVLFNSRDEAIKAIKEVQKNEKQAFQQWSSPIYPCPKCNGNMRMNMLGGKMLASNPPIYQSKYQCDKCGFIEYL